MLFIEALSTSHEDSLVILQPHGKVCEDTKILVTEQSPHIIQEQEGIPVYTLNGTGKRRTHDSFITDWQDLVYCMYITKVKEA